MLDGSGQYPQLVLQGGLGIVIGAISIACSIVIILGAIKMMKLESYGVEGVIIGKALYDKTLSYSEAKSLV